jgi:hypothetical protein
MSNKAENHKWGNCGECGESMRLKPKDRKFCKPHCRYRHRNKIRPRPNLEFAIVCVAENLLTIKEAEALGAGTAKEIRAKIRRKELPSIKMFGRVLLNKCDVKGK